MKVFIAGATGAIGHPLISRLVAAGHDVVGMTSSERGLQTLREAGAEGVVANALDAQAVQVAMNKARPDAVIEELTSLPKHYTPEEMRAAADRDRTVRLEGGRNLQNAARAAGARRYIVQSTGFFYAPGPGLATETEPLALDASPAVSASVRTYIQIEQRVLSSSDQEGVALRYGFFYGPGTWFTIRRSCPFGFRPLRPSWEHRNHQGSARRTPSKLRGLIGSTIQPVCVELPTQRQNANFASHQGNSSGWRSAVPPHDGPVS